MYKINKIIFLFFVWKRRKENFQYILYIFQDLLSKLNVNPHSSHSYCNHVFLASSGNCSKILQIHITLAWLKNAFLYAWKTYSTDWRCSMDIENWRIHPPPCLLYGRLCARNTHNSPFQIDSVRQNCLSWISLCAWQSGNKVPTLLIIFSQKSKFFFFRMSAFCEVRLLSSKSVP